MWIHKSVGNLSSSVPSIRISLPNNVSDSKITDSNVFPPAEYNNHHSGKKAV